MKHFIILTSSLAQFFCACLCPSQLFGARLRRVPVSFPTLWRAPPARAGVLPNSLARTSGAYRCPSQLFGAHFRRVPVSFPTLWRALPNSLARTSGACRCPSQLFGAHFPTLWRAPPARARELFASGESVQIVLNSGLSRIISKGEDKPA
jgi:hypothetical protein